MKTAIPFEKCVLMVFYPLERRFPRVLLDYDSPTGVAFHQDHQTFLMCKLCSRMHQERMLGVIRVVSYKLIRAVKCATVFTLMKQEFFSKISPPEVNYCITIDYQNNSFFFLRG